MTLWCTEIKAVDPVDGRLKKWIGPKVPGENKEDADRYCQDNGLGYCIVVSEISIYDLKGFRKNSLVKNMQNN